MVSVLNDLLPNPLEDYSILLIYIQVVVPIITPPFFMNI
jgi:hypothetical protein